jgi:dienelactone hydrolase
MTNEAQGTLVHIKIDSVVLEGELVIPPKAVGIVIFAHGSGSSRHSPRNKSVAEFLQKEGIGTLLFDLLTSEEDTNYETRFNIDLLTKRLKAATLWLRKQPQVANLPFGYFGSSTGAAASLDAAASIRAEIYAVVSRGGRPDLAWGALTQVSFPVLLIVGGYDETVIELNKKALERVRAEKKLEIIPGATHLFEEEGALEEVSRLAADWFKQHLGSK